MSHLFPADESAIVNVKCVEEQLSMDGPSYVSPNTSFENKNGKVIEGQNYFDHIRVLDQARQ